MLDGRVLCLIQYDERIVERSPPHEGEWCHFDDIALNQFGDAFEPQHFIERIVEWAQVGIDLLRYVAGQEAETFASFDGRAH